MGEVIHAEFSPKPTDGGKARIMRHRDNFRFRNLVAPTVDIADHLLMDHADPCDTAPCEYVASPYDPA